MPGGRAGADGRRQWTWTSGRARRRRRPSGSTSASACSDGRAGRWGLSPRPRGGPPRRPVGRGSVQRHGGAEWRAAEPPGRRTATPFLSPGAAPEPLTAWERKASLCAGAGLVACAGDPSLLVGLASDSSRLARGGRQAVSGLSALGPGSPGIGFSGIRVRAALPRRQGFRLTELRPSSLVARISALC